MPRRLAGFFSENLVATGDAVECRGAEYAGNEGSDAGYNAGYNAGSDAGYNA